MWNDWDIILGMVRDGVGGVGVSVSVNLDLDKEFRPFRFRCGANLKIFWMLVLEFLVFKPFFFFFSFFFFLFWWFPKLLFLSAAL